MAKLRPLPCSTEAGTESENRRYVSGSVTGPSSAVCVCEERLRLGLLQQSKVFLKVEQMTKKGFGGW